MKLYRRYEALSPVYQGYLTNHLPMYLQILREYNLPKEIIIERLNQYKDDRDLYSLTDPTYPTSDFEQSYVQRTSTYLGDIHRYGVDVVVGKVVNEFKHGFHGHLFHGMIRLMYALRSSYDLLIAQALAYLSLVADIEPLSRPHESFTKIVAQFDTLQQMVQDQDIDSTLPTMDRFQELYDTPNISSQLFEMISISTHRDVLLDWLLKKYQQQGGFFTLHAITGLHALLELEEYIVDFDQVFNELWVAIQLFVAMDNTKDTIVPSPLIEWDTIQKDMVSLCDVHQVKLVFSLHKLSVMYDIKLAQQIASSIIINKKRY